MGAPRARAARRGELAEAIDGRDFADAGGVFEMVEERKSGLRSRMYVVFGVDEIL